MANPYEPPKPGAPIDAALAEQLDAPQTVTVALQPEDHVAFVNHLNNTDPTVRRVLRMQAQRLLLLSGFLGGLSFVVEHYALSSSVGIVTLRVAAIYLLVIALLRGPIARRRSRRRVAHSLKLGLYGIVDKETAITVDTPGIQTQDSGGESLRYWSGVERVAATGEHLFIYWHASQALILPLRAFQTEAQFNGWCELSQRLWGAAHAQDSSNAEKPLGNRAI